MMVEPKWSDWAELGRLLQMFLGEGDKALANFVDNMEVIEKGVQQFAKEGWPISSSLAAQQVLGLVAIARESSVANAFAQLYNVDDGHEIGRAFAQMRSSPRMAKWTNLLTEIEHSFRDRRHLICVPALLTMLEGLAFTSPTGSRKMTQAIGEHAARVGKDPSTNLATVIWRGIETFVNELFSYSRFTAAEPPLNRHWILHGRATADWTREDAIRLLHAVRVLHESLDDLDAAAGNPPSTP